MKDGHGRAQRVRPGTYRPLQNKDNDYMMDRAAQKRGDTYSGVKGISMQDASLQESMGPIVDRTKERLVSTDSGIIMARRKLWRAVEALRDEGVTPPGVDVDAPGGPVGRGRAAEGPVVHRGLRRRPARAPGREARVGVSAPTHSPTAPGQPQPAPADAAQQLRPRHHRRRGQVPDQLPRVHPPQLAGDRAWRGVRADASGRWGVGRGAAGTSSCSSRRSPMTRCSGTPGPAARRC